MTTNITSEEINQLPLKSYEGEVVLISDKARLARVFEEVRAHRVVGFDTETKPVFVRGRWHPVALIQVATDERVYLIRTKSTGITKEIVAFLEDPAVTKAGIGTHDDIRALQKVKMFKPNGFLDLTTLAKKAGLEVQSIKKLTALLLGFRISKGPQTSDWEAPRLTERQIRYAATDAWACLRIYGVLKGMR